MRPWGRRSVALAGLSGAIVALLCVAAAGFADIIKSEVELSTKEADSKESQLADVVADTLRSSAKSDAAFIAATSFNDSTTLPKGNVNTKDLLNAVVHKDENIVVVKLKGDQITRALEQGLYLYPKPNSAFLQFSGLTVTINPQAAAGKRVVSVKVGDDALEPGKVYKVAMPAPLANGGLAYFKIWSKSDIDKDTEKTIETALTAYLSAHKTITKGDDRLVIKGK
ncbi:MAG TPA: 5'-nucleotidase [Chthonomonadaceae bacterium]|nr:5'-nucleotidase [Chthonomonadaceae bacterium]